MDLSYSLGNLKIKYRALDEAQAHYISNFLKNIRGNFKPFFIEIEANRKGLKEEFKEGLQVPHKGEDFPFGWELKEKDGRFLVYVGKYDGCFAFERKGKEGIKIELDENLTYNNVLKIGTIDLLQIPAPYMTRGILIEVEGKGFLITGKSKSGKTSLFMQLIKFFDLSLISEERVIVENGHGFRVTTEGFIRTIQPNQYFDFSKIVNTKDTSKIDFVLECSTSSDFLKEVQIYESLKPFHRDWFLNVFTKEEIEKMVEEKQKEIKKIKARAYRINPNNFNEVKEVFSRFIRG
jgi:hypothetical protein